MPRFFLEPESWGGSTSLTGDEATHCARVLRAKEGDRIEVFDGQGRCAMATIASVAKSEIRLELGETRVDPRLEVPVILCQAILKGKAMDWLIQKAVEMGVSMICPVMTEHVVAKPGESKAEKWRRTVLEACKQCGQNYLPEVLEPINTEELASVLPPGERLMASLAEPRQPISHLLREISAPESLQWLVGPEGDLTQEELKSLINQGFQPVTLGPRVLRSETAALYGIAVCSNEFQYIT